MHRTNEKLKLIEVDITMKRSRSNSEARSKKVAILCTHPVQYFAPFFRELGELSKIESKVFFGCLHGAQGKSYDPDFGISIKWDCNILEGYQWYTSSRKSLTDLNQIGSLGLAIKTCLQIIKYDPDYVFIFAYSPFYIAACSLMLILAKKKILLRADTSDSALQRSKPKGLARDIILSFYYKFVYHFFPIGSESYDHYIRLGVCPQKLSTAVYAVDKKVIKPIKNLTYKNDMQYDRKDIINIGFVGKFTPVKDPLTIIEAITHLSIKERNMIRIKTAGTGPLFSEFMSQCKKACIQCQSEGFLNQTEMPAFYQLIDLLILPSVQGEVWGLVVNEALSQGVKVIVSDNVGCRHDLVSSSSAGWVFPAGQSRMLAAKLKEALAMWPWTKRNQPTPFISDLTTAVLDIIQ
ncbi:MAG: glycosyltransferase family 4 protein [Synechococcus sp. MIT S9220]|uniref:glycosyltransferase family 4 protein n=1 Tax=unclassified Synechococcus TaxID=2626047 RepID=UPI00164AC300|nr:glycosyltransferase family 4 protein [Synechococcus sp. MIT S9220]NOL47562.1 glycosyltransferase family 4 protein [Synechococcus sp. MIT S9220]